MSTSEAPEPAVVISRRDGTVTAQNRAALRILGQARGRTCWDLTCAFAQHRYAACAPDCVRRVMEQGGGGQRGVLIIKGIPHVLNCIPVGEYMVSMCIPPHEGFAGSMRVTARERQVLALVAQGMNTRAIAAELGVREATVRAHLEHMRVRTGASTRASLVATAIRLGLI